MAEEERITLRLPADLHGVLTAHAKRDQRSLNGQIVYLLRQATRSHAGSDEDLSDDERGDVLGRSMGQHIPIRYGTSDD